MAIKIKDITCRVIRNSSRKETIETSITLENGSRGVYSVPSGESRGSLEVEVFPPEGAIKVINGLKNRLLGRSFRPQEFDNELIKFDGTKKKSQLGGNTVLSLSVSFLKACALSQKTPLYLFILEQFLSKKEEKPEIPKLMLNLIEGGKHAWDSLDIQEVLLIPAFAETRRCVDFALKVLSLLKESFGSESRFGAEGGVSYPGFHSNRKALEMLQSACLTLGMKDFQISIDAAANSFKKGDKYFLKDANLTFDSSKLANWYVDMAQSYNLFSIEDPFAEEEWESWQNLLKQLGGKTKLIGDDLTVTNRERLQKAIDLGAIGGLILKPNQVGTISETLQAAHLAKENGMLTIVSHRAEETMDDFIADLAVGIRADFLKAGAPTQKERMVKYQRLIRIEEEIKYQRSNLKR